MNLLDLGVLTRNRRTELGLSQAQLASMSGLSRTTINLLENGSLNDLGMAKAADLMNVLGIEMQINAPIRKKPHALLMASRSASVSYRESMSAKELASALASGSIPPSRISHMATLIDELPISMLVRAVEEASTLAKVAPKKIWSHIQQWAHEFHSPRSVWN